jgi:hypothetical protein
MKKKFWTKSRCAHMADFLRAIALGVLAYYGYQAQHFWSLGALGALLAASLLEGLALVIINGEIRGLEK